MAICPICGEYINNYYDYCSDCYHYIKSWENYLQELSLNQLLDFNIIILNSMQKAEIIPQTNNLGLKCILEACAKTIKDYTSNSQIYNSFTTFLDKYNYQTDKLSNLATFEKKYKIIKNTINTSISIYLSALEDLNNSNFQKNQWNYKNLNILQDNSNQIKDYRKKYEAEYRTDDGHYVRSQGEMLIDNWLYKNNFLHEYEKTIFVNNIELHPDFYIKSKNTYIEYFGINNDNYREQSENKKQIYKNNNIKCIYLYPDDIKNLADILNKELLKIK